MPKKRIPTTKDTSRSEERADADSPGAVPAIRLSQKTLASYLRKSFLNNLPALVDELYPALLTSVKKREPWAVKAGLEIVGLSKDKNGINISLVQQNNNANTAVAESSSNSKSFSQIVRALDERAELERKLPAPVTIDTVAQ